MRLAGARRCAGEASSFVVRLVGVSAAHGAAPDARQPRLLLARQSVRPIVVLELGEACRSQVAAPRRFVVPDPVASAVPALLSVAARVRAEEHSTRLERGMQLA